MSPDIVESRDFVIVQLRDVKNEALAGQERVRNLIRI